MQRSSLRVVFFLALLLVASIPSSIFAQPQISTAACTPTITQAELDNWSRVYANTVAPNTPPNTAFGGWLAAKDREVPELSCLSRITLADIYNMINTYSSKDSHNSFTYAPDVLNFWNEQTASYGDAFLLSPVRIFYWNGATLTSAVWTG